MRGEISHNPPFEYPLSTVVYILTGFSVYMYCHNSYFHLSSGGIFYVYFHLHGRGF